MKTAVIRRAHFNAAHRIYNPAWDDVKNHEVFGPCSNPHYHGHNYEMEIMVTGDVNPDTGYVINLTDLKRIIKEEVEDHMDHKNLNIEVPEFADLIPTAEHIARVIYERIRPHLDEDHELQIKLYETPRNIVIYPA